MVTHCNNKQINYKDRLLLHEAVVRTQLDHGMPVMNYDYKEMQRLRNLQNEAETNA